LFIDERRTVDAPENMLQHLRLRFPEEFAIDKRIGQLPRFSTPESVDRN
jgi:hypothetical protein